MTRAMVVHDSFFGNTAEIGRAIAEGLGRAVQGADVAVEVCQVGDIYPEQLMDLDVLVVGSPTRGFRPSPAVSGFLKSIPRGGLAGVRVAAYDTRFTKEKIQAQGWLLSTLVDLLGTGAYAARSIADRLVKLGGELVLPPEGFYVEGTEGPLLAGEFERAARWAQQIPAQQPVV